MDLKSRKEIFEDKRRHRGSFVALFSVIAILGLGVGTTYLVHAAGGVQSVKRKNTVERRMKEESTEKSPASTTRSSTFSSETSTSDEENKDMATNVNLKKGSNHNQKASAYSFSGKDIQSIMDGVKEPMTDKQRVCFLTFDDGANTTITPQILDVLKKEQVPATFFVVGNRLGQEAKPILEREIAEGHAIALHSFNHDYDLLYPGRFANPDQVAKEAKQTQSTIQGLLGQDFYSSVWRYPGGHMSWENINAADEVLAQQNIYPVDWNAMSGDAQPLGDRPMTAQTMADYQANSTTEYPDVHLRVVLMHDAEDKNLTVEALPAIIQFYKDHEFTFGVLE